MAFSNRSTTKLASVVALLIALVFAPLACAQETANPVDPDAIAALKKMSAYLKTLKSFQVTADETSDDVLDTGQLVQYSNKVDILASKPNHFRIEVKSDEKHRLFFYDGKNFTVYGKILGYYATVPAPPTIAKLIEVADEKYDISFPLTDLFTWGDTADVKSILSAIDMGPATVDGITCEQYAFHEKDVDWQAWIQLGEYPLPRKLVITTLTDEARPQHSDMLTWNLAPSFSEDAFTFDPPADAKRIVLADKTASTTAAGK